MRYNKLLLTLADYGSLYRYSPTDTQIESDTECARAGIARMRERQLARVGVEVRQTQYERLTDGRDFMHRQRCGAASVKVTTFASAISQKKKIKTVA